MKIGQYNILDGSPEPERLVRLGQWISRQNYDILGFNELNGWTTRQMEQYGAEWGLPYYAITDTGRSPYRLGILSKHPVERVSIKEEGFYHGLLHAKILDLDLFVTHLSSADSLHREREAALIIEEISTCCGPVIVMGDLNTLSPLDKAHYDHAGIPEKLSQDDRLSRKFMAQGEINYRPMEVLLEAGLVDAGAGSGFQHSVPTKYNEDPMHADRLRLDYMLINEALLNHKPMARIIRDPEVELLSDHYPVECWW
ncbi:endonuclease/exonuclease/phosphatase family protein [Paenibacillus spongiae]|uniref:Endonuclease/exonuclease/phosphatase family protein n=1 Tax=Paenibacillus spongiae TaxID=2909671 RepID=A0ABY5SCI3_9BACL|nr:endonuclease/exonuclease/phosphatase family protein [Paenibacillus spongiae]UVI31671.1 endonuclease/exonuclease/phosphatase family protein [Paenibacillus spongiae]